jgi:large subunit ribosomal protein L33
MVREYVWLACTKCKRLNYRASREKQNTDKLQLKKYCRFDREHTVHKESRKK